VPHLAREFSMIASLCQKQRCRISERILSKVDVRAVVQSDHAAVS
jgi:hypothetical protein